MFPWKYSHFTRDGQIPCLRHLKQTCLLGLGAALTGIQVAKTLKSELMVPLQTDYTVVLVWSESCC